MSTLLLFILITAIIILTPVFKAIFKVGQTVHSFKKAYNEQTKQYQQAKEQQAQTAEINNRKERARAYFKRASEDAEFEEIATERKVSNDQSSTTGSNTRKSNVSDAKFEEIN